MIHVTYYNRDKRPGNFSIEEVFSNIRIGLEGKIRMSDYDYNPSMGRWKSIRDVSLYQGDVNHITGDVNYLSYGLKPDKTILTVHDAGHFENTLRGWKKTAYKYLWMKWPLERVKFVTAISEFTKSRLIYNFGIPSEKIRVIHNPFPVRFQYTPFSFNNEQPRILQIGPGHNKNIYRLLEAIENISCKLVLIRKYDPALEALIKRKGINYEWHSDLTYDQVNSVYQSCDMVFFASEYEGFGVPIVEANSIGRPVLTGNITAMPEVAGNAACLVDPFDVGSIRNGIQRIIESDSYRAELISAGIENVKRFDLNKITQQYLQLYQEVASL